LGENGVHKLANRYKKNHANSKFAGSYGRKIELNSQSFIEGL